VDAVVERARPRWGRLLKRILVIAVGAGLGGIALMLGAGAFMSGSASSGRPGAKCAYVRPSRPAKRCGPSCTSKLPVS